MCCETEKLRTALIKIGQAVTDPSRCGELTVGWIKRKVAEALAPAPQEESVVVNITARSLREQILDGKQEEDATPRGKEALRRQNAGLRLQELESSLRAVYDELALRPRIKGLHLIPFEEWLAKRAIDGDQEADELLALRQTPQSGAPIRDGVAVSCPKDCQCWACAHKGL